MNIVQVRNVTRYIISGGRIFLINPMLAAGGTYPGFAGTIRAEIRNPIVDLPVDTGTLLNAGALTATHLHEGHWDEVAARVAPKDKLIYVQNDRDVRVLREQGFTRLTVLMQNITLGDITLRKTGGRYGSDCAYAIPQAAGRLGDICGVIFQRPTGKTPYSIGDIIWRDRVETNTQTFQPGVVTVNVSFTYATGLGPIIIGVGDVPKTYFTLFEAQIAATHMEVTDHCLSIRAISKEYVYDNQIT